MRKRTQIISGAALIAALGAAAFVAEAKRPPPGRFHDPYFTLPYKLHPVQEGVLQAFQNELGVDLHVLIDSVPGTTDLASYALKEARRRGIGRTNDRRGMLILFELASGDVRIEVGPTLEGLFPDGLVGRLIRGHVAGKRAEDSMAHTLVSTLNVIRHRLREASLALDYDAAMRTDIQDSTRLAAGGGATYAVESGGPLRLQRVLDPILEESLGPGRTAAEALATYKNWLSLPVCVPRATFLTVPSRDFFDREFKMTPQYWEFLRYLYVPTAMAVAQRDDVAIAYATVNPLIPPLYFRRTTEGWQMDVMAEVLHSRSTSGGLHAWFLHWTGDEFDLAFRDIMVRIDGYTRFKGGANRRIVRDAATVATPP